MATVPLFEDRSRAESFGSVADLYDRARPSYPPALIDALLADGGRTVLDVGCGTGIAPAAGSGRSGISATRRRSSASGSRRSTTGWRPSS